MNQDDKYHAQLSEKIACIAMKKGLLQGLEFASAEETHFEFKSSW